MALALATSRLSTGALIGALALALASTGTPPAAAQSPDGKTQLAQGFFERLFGPLPGSGPQFSPETPRQVDPTRPPPARKPDTPPSSTVMIFGDSLAEWLAYGLEDALTDTPEFGIVRKARFGSGLIRYDLRNEALDWAQAVRETIAAEKPNIVVMMIGLNDRQAIRVGPATARKPGVQAEKPVADQEQENPEQQGETPDAAQRARAPVPGIYDFHTERWEDAYIKRIDDTIAALKSRGVPVFWVGLPSFRVAKTSTDASYLNELFRARAEKAGIVYVDIWDGFVDDQGKFAMQGPDYEGQNRRLRASDGVHFTRAGARKLAHYLEREINRLTPAEPSQVALPGAEPQQLTPGGKTGGPSARPLVGPAVPLAAFAYARATDELTGSPINRNPEEPPTQAATAALVKGETMAVPAGRADDFAWPRRPIAAVGTDPAVTSTTMPVPLAQLPPPPPAAETPSKTAAARPAAPLGGGLQQQPRFQQPRPAFNPFSFFPFFR